MAMGVVFMPREGLVGGAHSTVYQGFRHSIRIFVSIKVNHIGQGPGYV